ncbi:MAG: hypothetical protein KAR20_22775, partial [Candidatus Heimdallarchaeota archaeon]|nr:hypothetical protein [Candidatus Heimdallarchaeota archaeon]
AYRESQSKKELMFTRDLPAEKMDPGIQTIVIPAALNALANINNNDIRKHAAEILESHKAQPTSMKDGQAYVGYLIALKRWDELIKIGEPAVDLLLKAIEDKSHSFQGDIFNTLGTLCASLTNQTIVKQKVIPFLMQEIMTESSSNTTDPFRVLGIINASPNCDEDARYTIVNFLIEQSVERTSTGPGTPLTVLSPIAAALPVTNPLKEKITNILLESDADVFLELEIIELSLPKNHELREKIINKFKNKLTDENVRQRQKSVESLERIGWKPQTTEDKLIFYYAGEKWDKLVDMGVESLDFLMRHLVSESGRADEDVGASIFRIAADIISSEGIELIKARILEPVFNLLLQKKISGDDILRRAGLLTINLYDGEYTKTRLLPLILKLDKIDDSYEDIILF